MKKIYVFIALCALTVGCHGAADYTVTLKIGDGTATGQQLYNTFGVLRSRLDRSGIKVVSATLDGNEVIISHNTEIDDRELERLLTTPGVFSFREVYDPSKLDYLMATLAEFHQGMTEPEGKEAEIFSVLHPWDGSGPAVGYIEAGSLEAVTQSLDSPLWHNYFPRDGRPMLKPAWQNEQLYELVIVRDMPENWTDYIVDSKVDSDYGSYAVWMVFNSEGTEKFAALTDENRGNYLALVMDDTLLSVPRVNERVSAGRSMITGGLSLEEATFISNILKSGVMEAPVEIVSVKRNE